MAGRDEFSDEKALKHALNVTPEPVRTPEPTISDGVSSLYRAGYLEARPVGAILFRNQNLDLRASLDLDILPKPSGHLSGELAALESPLLEGRRTRVALIKLGAKRFRCVLTMESAPIERDESLWLLQLIVLPARRLARCAVGRATRTTVESRPRSIT